MKNKEELRDLQAQTTYKTRAVSSDCSQKKLVKRIKMVTLSV